MRVRWSYLGQTPYAQAGELMTRLKNDIREGSAVEYLLFLEHPNVITRGYSERGADAGLISSREEIAAAGFELVQTDRGGKTTLHNPGQLVGYTIFDLKRNNYRIKTFVQMIEETLMDTLATFDLTGERRKNDPGLYVEGKKIAFLGLNVDGPVTTHGFSINVRNDLRPFGHIVPCGQLNRPITSILELVGGTVSVYDVYWRFIVCFEKRTGAQVEEVSAQALF